MLRSSATARRVLWTLERRLAGLQLETTTSCLANRRFSSEETKEAFPPNLWISPRSSYAPKRVARAPLSDEEEDSEGDEEDTAAEADEEEDSAYYDSSDDEEEDVELQFQAPEKSYVVPLPDRLHVPIYNFGSEEGLEEVGKIHLEESIFGLDPIRVDFLKRAVDYYRNKKRGRRKAKTKRIGDIRGSGKKLRAQKGSGMARVGHKKTGIRRGGAKAHGPRNETDYGKTKLNKKVRRKAVQHVLAAKLKQGDLILVNQFHNLPTHKTKILVQWLKPFGIAGRRGCTGLLLDNYYPDEDEEEDEDNPQATSYNGLPVNLEVASGNLYQLKIGNQLNDLNVYDVLKYEKLVLSMDALTAIEARLKDDY